MIVGIDRGPDGEEVPQFFRPTMGLDCRAWLTTVKPGHARRLFEINGRRLKGHRLHGSWLNEHIVALVLAQGRVLSPWMQVPMGRRRVA